MEKGIVVVGAGGHAKVCIESLRAMGKQVDYCIGEASDHELCVGVPILAGDENLKRLREEGYETAFIAIGSNRLRKRLGALVTDMGYRLTNAIHPGAVVSPTATLGEGVAIMAGAVINAEASIGALSIVNTGATVDHDCRIGEAVHIAPQCGLAGNVKVSDLSFLGVGTRVIPGIQIGTNVIVGAGAVIISDIDDEKTVVGVPARLIK
jgi:UDP-perosamine 4-acetyltransferase